MSGAVSNRDAGFEEERQREKESETACPFTALPGDQALEHLPRYTCMPGPALGPQGPALLCKVTSKDE